MKNNKIGKYFSLTELTKSQTALRKGIDNTPDDIHLLNLMELCDSVLDPLREQIDKLISVNSGYRSKKLNRAIGGSKTSQHCKGQAADIECYATGNYELARIISLEYDFDQLILECWDEDANDPLSGWVHVSFVSKEKNRKQVLAFDGKTYRPYRFKHVFKEVK